MVEQLFEELNLKIVITDNKVIYSDIVPQQHIKIELTYNVECDKINEQDKIIYIYKQLLNKLKVATTTAIQENPHDDIRKC